MALLKSVQLQHVRTHELFTIPLAPGVTVITGKNGSGKTSIIEAIYLALQGSSFKGSDSDILSYHEPWWRIEVLFEDDSKRIVKFDPARLSGKKQFVIDEKTTYRLPANQKEPIVLFEPDDLRLLHGSPSRRRQFIDRFISQLDPFYGAAIRKYDRALKQRNSLLKTSNSPDEMFVWNVSLAEHGAYIIEKRIAFIEQINRHLNDAYNEIAQSPDTVSIHYSHTLIGDMKQKLLSELHAAAERDTHLGFTSIGPHRHDVIFQFNDSPALSVASRGEVRSIVLALKFLEVDIIEQITGTKPLILLDDVFSELDIDRQNSLSDTIRSHQIIITSTHVLSTSNTYQNIQL